MVDRAVSSVAQPDFADPVLNAALQHGLEQVEDLLRTETQSKFDFVTTTSRYLAIAGGKRFRPLFTLLAAQFGNAKRQDVIKAATLVELIHLASLYHDDVMDEAALRRGALSANTRWNNTIAILTGDFLFARASDLVADLGTEAGHIMADTFTELVTGQLRETIGPTETDDPITHYLTVINEKTGSLIAASGKLGARAAEVAPDYVAALYRYGREFGIAFQISDDIIDIVSGADESGKTAGTDLREGVRTLPVLYALAEESSTAERLAKLLAEPLVEESLVAEALTLLRASSGLTEAKQTLIEYANRAKAALGPLPDNSAKTALELLTDQVVARSS